MQEKQSNGTAFSSEYYDYQLPTKVILPKVINNITSENNNKNQKEILYYQLYFSKIESIPRIIPEVDNTIIGGITRIFSTGSLRNSNFYQHRNTDISSGSGFENKSGSSNRYSGQSVTEKANLRRSTSTNSSQRNNSQSTVSLLNSSHGINNNSNNNENAMENTLTITERISDEIVSERSLEYDNLEGGVMLERTNSGRSVPTDDGWNLTY